MLALPAHSNSVASPWNRESFAIRTVRCRTASAPVRDTRNINVWSPKHSSAARESQTPPHRRQEDPIRNVGFREVNATVGKLFRSVVTQTKESGCISIFHLSTQRRNQCEATDNTTCAKPWNSQQFGVLSSMAKPKFLAKPRALHSVYTKPVETLN